MANTPKHKLFFGIPYGRPVQDGKIDPDDGTASKPTVKPCWTWDQGSAVFSSGSLRFDCGYNIDYEISKQLETSGFTWDNNVVTLDTESQIF